LHENSEITGNSPKAEKALKEDFPDIYKHLKHYQKDLSERNTDETGIRYEWYALQRCAASYYKEFDKFKIVWGLTADKWAFAYDDKKHYLPSNGYILTSSSIDLKYLLALLNSRLLQFYFSFIGIMTAGGAYTLKHETIQEMPIIEGTDKTRNLFISLVDYILSIYARDQVHLVNIETIERILNGCIYELYFCDEMTKADINIITLVEKDLELVKNLNSDKAILKLCEKWQEPKNEVRNRLLLMTTRCSDTIGIIEKSIS